MGNADAFRGSVGGRVNRPALHSTARDGEIIPAVPLCADCRHAREGWFDRVVFRFGWRYARCYRGKIEGSASLVTGKDEERDRPFCSLEREDSIYFDRCGTAGRYWERRR